MLTRPDVRKSQPGTAFSTHNQIAVTIKARWLAYTLPHPQNRNQEHAQEPQGRARYDEERKPERDTQQQEHSPLLPNRKRRVKWTA